MNRRVIAPPPFVDLATLDAPTAWREVVASLVGAAISVPQGVAYAVIAGLPPAMGLYAAALPAVVGSLLRSSRTVVVGPTNAISLIVATSAISALPDRVGAVATLALLVGVLQIAAAAMRLSGLVDYLSVAVVTGYITGAATQIIAGQLPNLTATPARAGNIVVRLVGWVSDLGHLHAGALFLGVAAGATIVALRSRLPRGVAPMIALTGATLVAWLFGMDVKLVRDIASIPQGLPPFALPSLDRVLEIGPTAVAAMVLSLVESSSVSRSLAARTGERIDVSADFAGLGAANLAAALFGGYPVSGSLARSGLNVALGARTRLAGMLGGVWVLLVPLGLGPLLDKIPVAALAGMIVVLAVDLVDRDAIRRLMRSGMADRLAFLGTVLGTWLLPLDQAIYTGVGISIVMFLQRARMLVVRELWVDDDLHLREVDTDRDGLDRTSQCPNVRVVHIEGPLFFGSASELDHALTERIDDPDVKVLIVRLKRAQGIDYTCAAVLERAHETMRAQGRHLMLVGMRPDVMRHLQDIGVAETFATQELFPTAEGWFTAMNAALGRAIHLTHPAPDGSGAPVGPGSCGGGCLLTRYVEHRLTTPRIAR